MIRLNLDELVEQAEYNYNLGQKETAIAYTIIIINSCDDIEQKEHYINVLMTLLSEISYIVDFARMRDIFLRYFNKNEVYSNSLSALTIDQIEFLMQVYLNYRRIHEDINQCQILRTIEQDIEDSFGTNCIEFSLVRSLSIIYYYQAIDINLSIKLFTELSKKYIEELETIYPVHISDLYSIVGSILNSYQRRLAEARELLTKGYKMRSERLGVNSIFSLYTKVFLAENFGLSGEFEKAKTHSLEIINSENSEDITWMRCYASIIIAKTSVEQEQYDEALEWILLSDELCEDIDINSPFYDNIFININILYSQYYNFKQDLINQEKYSLTAYSYLKEHEIYNENYLVAINNLALCLYYSGRQEDSQELITEALGIIKKYQMDNCNACSYIYDMISVIDNESYFGISTEDAIKASRSIRKSRCKSAFDLVRVNLNYANCILKQHTLSNKTLQIVKNIINESETTLKTLKAKRVELLIQLAKIKAIYYYKLGDNMCSKSQILKAINLLPQNRSDEEDELIFNMVINMMDIIPQVLDNDSIRYVLFTLLQNYKFRLSSIVAQDDMLMILKALWRNNVLINLIIYLSEIKKINCSDEEAYEILSNGKAILSLLLKERKNLRKNNPQYKEIYDKIDDLEKLIIRKETEKLFRQECIDTSELQKQKRQLELTIVDKVKLIDFKWIKINDIYRNLPENSVLIDYYCYHHTFNSTILLRDLRYAQFALTKKSDGSVLIRRIPCMNALKVREDVIGLVGTMRATRNQWLAPVVADLYRVNLYNKLLRPLQPLLTKNIKSIYISPDFDLHMLPFSILGKKKKDHLINKFSITIIESARDLSSNKEVDILNAKALVVGNASFSLNNNDVEVSSKASKFKCAPLPLSKIEAMLVSEKLSTSPYMRHKASKRLLDEVDADIIHIATHGCYFDNIDDNVLRTNPMRRSCLLMSGFNDWLRCGTYDSLHGNGVLTAEEVYLSNMKPPKLVVLTACFSAMGEGAFGNGVVGLRTAFRANGAELMVLSIWETNDFASAVLIDKFYNNLKTMNISNALRNAQIYLRDITINMLKKELWFEENKLRRIGYNADALKKIAKMRGDKKIFNQIKHWGGYIVIQ